MTDENYYKDFDNEYAVYKAANDPQSALKALEGNSSYENPMSFSEFTGIRNDDDNPYDIWSKIGNFFGGQVNAARDEYNQYLSRLETKHNEQREDTAYQRSMKDIAAAGYNPLMALGSISPQSANSAVSYEKKDKSKDNTKEVGKDLISTALKVLALFLLS